MAALSDEMILAEAIRLVESGVSVTFPVNGRSMLPFIVGGRESLVLVRSNSIKVGDVVLAFVDDNRFVIHRVVRISGANITLMGDGNICQREFCKVGDVKAVATYAVDSTGKRRYLYTPFRRLSAKVWMWCRPARRFLLKFYFVLHSF